MKDFIVPILLVIFVAAFIRSLIYVQKRLETRRIRKLAEKIQAELGYETLLDYAEKDALYSMELFTAAEEARNDFQQPNRQDKQDPVG